MELVSQLPSHSKNLLVLLVFTLKIFVIALKKPAFFADIKL